MFKNILICSFVPTNNKHVIDTAFELAKKFDSNIIALKCIYESIPTFGFFKIKSEKKKHAELTQKIQLALKETEEMARHHNISIKTECVFVTSLSEHVITYVNKNDIDLLVVDSTPPTDIDEGHHKDIINYIYKNIECNVLTLK